jgi:hypothetical protein
VQTHLPFHRCEEILPGERKEPDDANDSIKLGVEGLEVLIIRVALLGCPALVKVQLRGNSQLIREVRRVRRRRTRAG